MTRPLVLRLLLRDHAQATGVWKTVAGHTSLSTALVCTTVPGWKLRLLVASSPLLFPVGESVGRHVGDDPFLVQHLQRRVGMGRLHAPKGRVPG